jgi:hypothetical protein
LIPNICSPEKEVSMYWTFYQYGPYPYPHDSQFRVDKPNSDLSDPVIVKAVGRHCVPSFYMTWRHFETVKCIYGLREALVSTSKLLCNHRKLSVCCK